jgi:hypothetical protein
MAKISASMWRDKAYELSGAPLPWNAEELIEKAVEAEREKVARWMAEHSYATGHGDTIEDLLKELEWQINERINAWEHSLAEAIRAREQV